MACMCICLTPKVYAVAQELRQLIRVAEGDHSQSHVRIVSVGLEQADGVSPEIPVAMNLQRIDPEQLRVVLADEFPDVGQRRFDMACALGKVGSVADARDQPAGLLEFCYRLHHGLFQAMQMANLRRRSDAVGSHGLDEQFGIVWDGLRRDQLQRLNQVHYGRGGAHEAGRGAVLLPLEGVDRVRPALDHAGHLQRFRVGPAAVPGHGNHQKGLVGNELVDVFSVDVHQALEGTTHGEVGAVRVRLEKGRDLVEHLFLVAPAVNGRIHVQSDSQPGHEGRVVVGVDEAGQHQLAAQVGDNGVVADEGLGASVVADVDDILPLNGDSFSPGLLIIDGIDLAVGQYVVGINGGEFTVARQLSFRRLATAE